MGNGTGIWGEHDTALDVEECCWPTCSAKLDEDYRVPVCNAHLIRIGIVFHEVTEQKLKDYRPFTPRSDEDLDERAQKYMMAAHAQSVVYYIRLGNHIKIGYSTNMKARLIGLRADPEDVLATEPGGLELEKQRHEEFKAERVGRRENFNPSPRLLAHIEAVLAEHGPPNITTYPKVA